MVFEDTLLRQRRVGRVHIIESEQNRTQRDEPNVALALRYRPNSAHRARSDNNLRNFKRLRWTDRIQYGLAYSVDTVSLNNNLTFLAIPF